MLVGVACRINGFCLHWKHCELRGWMESLQNYSGLFLNLWYYAQLAKARAALVDLGGLLCDMLSLDLSEC